jgi:hypothetical protein
VIQNRVPQGQPPQVQAPPVIQNQVPQGQVAPLRQHQAPQGQPPQVQAPPVIQNQVPQGQVVPWNQRQARQGQQHRRDNPAIQTYRGPDNYRPGSPPPIMQRRNNRLRDRDWYHRSYRAERRYHLRPYMRPRGWYLYDWTLGDILPSFFWSRNYWIVNYWLYGLPIPPDGCNWVRYDHDALLIDQYTGEVVEVIYDIFY